MYPSVFSNATNEIDILCMQETEIENGFNIELLRIPGFILELESNQHKSRTATYIRNNIPYKRRTELEGVNSHIVIIDLLNTRPIRICNIYRTFNPVGFTVREK